MPKSIQRSVGWGGWNVPADVAIVQYLLNCVPSAKGGPIPELAVDGLIGPKTIGAIRKFQKAAFGSADGRIDAGKRTIQTLLTYDPYPNQAAAGPGKSPFGGSGGKSGSGGAGKGGSGDPWKGESGKSGGGAKSF